jgi:ubiquinone/menaquinone biosynthesis C-methylase UbiE
MSGILIWITGLPYTGKTTVASYVSRLLEEKTQRQVIHLDGDLLRLVLQSSTIDSDQDRLRLGVSYALLGKALARQGHLVVVSAVAMYAEVFATLGDSPEASHVAYCLTADEPSRTQRSRGSSKAPATSPPASQSLLPPWIQQVDNSNGKDPEGAGHTIVEHALARVGGSLQCYTSTASAIDEIKEFGRHRSVRLSHWNSYYSSTSGIREASSFVAWFQARLPTSLPGTLLDYGCGNGRDSAALASGTDVVGVDSASAAIELADRLWRSQERRYRLQFMVGDETSLSQILQRHEVNHVYSRFVWHSLTESEEDTLLEILRKDLPVGGCLALEARTTSDPMSRRGSRLSTSERVFGHYRRFLEPEALIAKLQIYGFDLIAYEEGTGLAALGDDDPFVIRILAQKSHP